MLQVADRMVELNEGSPESRAARAALWISFGQFNRARADLSTIIQGDASLFYPTYQAALLALRLDDQAEYQELSRKLVSTVDDGSEPIAKHFAAWTASLSPDALDDYERAIELAMAAVKQDPADQQYLTGLGAIHLPPVSTSRR